VQQFIHRGSPAELGEREREILGRLLAPKTGSAAPPRSPRQPCACLNECKGASGRQLMGFVEDHQKREPSMGDITAIGLDLAKNVFQVHAVDEAGSVVMRKRLRRGQVLAFFAEDREQPDRLSGVRTRPTVKASIRGIHQGQRLCTTAQKGRIHDCKRPLLITQKILASRGPSIHEAALLCRS
jgi:hypothetical protein